MEEHTVAGDDKYVSMVAEKPGNIKFVPSNIPVYGVLASFAVSNDSSSLEFVVDEYKTESLCLEAIVDDPYNIRFVPTEKPFYTKLARVAVKLYGAVLEFIPRECQDFVMASNAIKQNQYNARFVDERLINHITIRRIAMQGAGIFFKLYDSDVSYTDYRYKLSDEKRQEFDKQLVRYNGSNLQYLDNEEVTTELCRIAFFSGTKALQVLRYMGKEHAHAIIEELIARIDSE